MITRYNHFIYVVNSVKFLESHFSILLTIHGCIYGPHGPGSSSQHSPSRWATDIYHPCLVTCWKSLLTSKPFVKQSAIVPSEIHGSTSGSYVKPLFDEKRVYLHMLHVIVLNRIICNIDWWFVVTPKVQIALSELASDGFFSFGARLTKLPMTIVFPLCFWIYALLFNHL